MTSPRPGSPDFMNQPVDVTLPKTFAPTLEIGRTGLRRVSGYVQEEFLPQLRGRKAVQVYREMSENSAVIGGFLFAIERLIRQVEWRVEPASQSAEDKANAEFVEQCMDDMSHSWGDMISEIMTMVIYGWNLSEVVFKKRVGPWERDPSKRSKHTDGRFGWRKISTRAQETILWWIFDDEGGIQGAVQMAPPRYERKPLPMGKCLLFRTSTRKNNPEGYSLLRNAYQSWWYLKRHMEIEAVGVERDLTGLPVAWVPPQYLDAAPNSREGAMLEAIKNVVQNTRRNEHEGMLFPLVYDGETGDRKAFDFQLMNSGGSRQFDTEAIINRYKLEMLQSVLADFMQVGHEDNGGSYALHTDKTGMFRTALNSLAQSIADVFNRHGIPQLFAVNGMKPAELPKIVANDVDSPNLAELGAFMTSMTGAGMQFFPDVETEKWVRDIARMPPLDQNTERIREIETRQAAIMSLAQQKLQMLQIDQQAQQGQMQVEQQSMANEGQRQQLSAGPDQAPAKDPVDAKRGQIAVATDKVKLEQQRQKLKDMKKPAPKTPIKKSTVSAFGVDHGWGAAA